MFKKLRQKIEVSDAVKKANDSIGKYWAPSGSSAADSPPDSAAGSGIAQPTSIRSRQSSVSSAASISSEASGSQQHLHSDAATDATNLGTQQEARLERLLLRRRSKEAELEKLRAALTDAQDRAAARGAEFRAKETCWASRLASVDRLVVKLREQAVILSSGMSVSQDFLAELEAVEASAASAGAEAPEAAGPADVPPQNGDGSGGSPEVQERGASSGESESTAISRLRGELESLRARLAESEAEAEEAARKFRDERAVAQEEAAAAKRRLKARLAEAMQQLAAREREAALKDSTGATRESEIRTLKERLDCRLASERRLREEATARSAEAATLAEQLRASRLEAEALAKQVREQRREMESGRAAGVAELEVRQMEKLKAAAREFQDRLDAKEREFQLRFQEAVERFQEAEARARATHRLETEELLQGLEEREVAEGRLSRRLAAAEAEAESARAAAEAAKLEASAALEAANAAEAARFAAAAEADEWRKRHEAASAAAVATREEATTVGGGAAEHLRTSLSGGGANSDWLRHLVDGVEGSSGPGHANNLCDVVSHEDYEAVKMYAADLHKQLMSVSSELAEMRSHRQLSAQTARHQQAQQHQHQNSQHRQLLPDMTSPVLTPTSPVAQMPEMEYLRHVLFKYMLGEKTQTLARVICTVLKFSESQIQQIMDHEGRRASTWLLVPRSQP